MIMETKEYNQQTQWENGGFYSSIEIYQTLPLQGKSTLSGAQVQILGCACCCIINITNLLCSSASLYGSQRKTLESLFK
jgi:hypothetical protein